MSKRTDELIRLDASNGASEIHVGAGLLARVGTLAAERFPRARVAWLVSDETVLATHGAATADALTAAGLETRPLAVPAGEASKSLAQLERLYDQLLGGNASRSDVVVALGGGVVGDLAGFIAATCLRGMPLVQVPTSLLAMVDSSVGGKTGINHATGKNLIGAFYQPAVVVVDPRLLSTLPRRELAAGWAEVIKYGLIDKTVPNWQPGERALLPWLEEESAALQELAEPATSAVIYRCIELKARVVREDPTEQGIRAILNYGHTIGHAVEARAGYGALLHGEAVAIGMRAAMALGQATGRCDAVLSARQAALIQRFGLPSTAPAMAPADLWPYLRRDKKASRAGLRWILPTTPGEVVVASDVDEALVDEALRLVTSH